MFNLIKINELRQLIDPLDSTMFLAVDVPSATDPSGYELKKVSASQIGGGDNIGNSDLTIDVAGVRKLVLGGFLSSDGFAISKADETKDFFTINGSGNAIMNLEAVGFNTGLQIKVNGLNRIQSDQYATRMFGQVYTDTMNGNGSNQIVLNSQSSGGTGGFIMHPYHSYITINANSFLNKVEPSTGTNFSLFARETGTGDIYPTFLLSNGDTIELYKQDLPATPTTTQIATLLSNIGYANLI